MNLTDLKDVASVEHRRQKTGLPTRQHEGTSARLSGSRVKDMGTHVRYMAEALERSDASHVDATELTEDNLSKVKDHLVSLGKGTAVVQNTLSNLRFLQDLAREVGVVIPDVAIALERPKKLQVFKRRNGKPGGVRITRRRPVEALPDSYGFKFRDWTKRLLAEWQDIVAFFSDLDRDHANRKQLRETTIGVRMNVFERYFGFLLLSGYEADDLSFRLVTNTELVKAFKRFKFGRRGFHTMTTKSELDIIRHLALNFFEAEECRAAFAKIIGPEERYVVQKDKDALVERFHPDELYELVDALYAEAQHYERNLKKKGRCYPEAQMAANWHRAALFAFTVTTMLRERNVAALKLSDLSKRDGVWSYRIKARDMKGDRAKTEFVYDLWQGDRATARLYQLLEKALEVRPLLLDKFRHKNPDQADPTAFFLNENGKQFSLSGIRESFYSSSARYLGPDHIISPHDIRSIVPSWLFVREGIEFLPTIQRLLDHKNINTTMKHYVRTQQIFNTQLAKRQMDERAKRKKDQEQLLATTDEIRAALDWLMKNVSALQGI